MNTDLRIEYCRSLVKAQQHDTALRVIEGLPIAFRDHGRIRILEAWAAIESGDLERAEHILDQKLQIAELREGEVILSDLWYSLQERRLSQVTGMAVDEKIKARVRRECVLPQHMDFQHKAERHAVSSPNSLNRGRLTRRRFLRTDAHLERLGGGVPSRESVDSRFLFAFALAEIED